jgi:serine/threonine-protein kinase
MSTTAWTAFFLTDLLAARGLGAPLEYLAALRFAGTGVGLAAYALVRSDTATARTLDVVEIVLFPAAALLVALAAIPTGGVTSPLALGIAMVTLARAIVPAPWPRALPTALACAASYPAAMGFATTGPAVAAQLRSPLVWTFALTALFLVLGAAVATAGSHLLWAARKELAETRRLGSYRLITRVGTGGMGEVWLARQMPLDRPVALKVLKRRMLEDAGAIRRFKREARAASRLQHPNTIRVYDFGASTDGVFYLAMELLDGLDLEALVVRTGPLPPARVVHLARQACASLAEAHGVGIVHCDVKPANVFVARVVGELDFVKVLDFGLARVLAGPGSTTVATGIQGTPAFMSPEAIRGERIGPESDVYAMGALLYYMLTATVVFRAAESFTQMITAHIEDAPDPPSKRIGAPIPGDLEAVVMRCLEKDPAARYRSAKALDDALAACACAGAWTQKDAFAAWEFLRPSLTTKRIV